MGADRYGDDDAARLLWRKRVGVMNRRRRRRGNGVTELQNLIVKCQTLSNVHEFGSDAFTAAYRWRDVTAASWWSDGG